MKYLLAILILTVFRLETSASCMIFAKSNGLSYNVSLWKHTEGKEDDVLTRNFQKKDLIPFAYIFSQYDSVKFIFNNNEFTALRFEGGTTKRWGNLTDSEKDVVRFIKRKFDISEH